MKIDRLLGIITVLLQNEKVTAPYLAEKFEVSRRTINSCLLYTSQLIKTVYLKTQKQISCGKKPGQTDPVSYTHLDVYKRQAYKQLTSCKVRSYTGRSLHYPYLSSKSLSQGSYS